MGSSFWIWDSVQFRIAHDPESRGLTKPSLLRTIRWSKILSSGMPWSGFAGVNSWVSLSEGGRQMIARSRLLGRCSGFLSTSVRCALITAGLQLAVFANLWPQAENIGVIYGKVTDSYG